MILIFFLKSFDGGIWHYHTPLLRAVPTLLHFMLLHISTDLSLRLGSLLQAILEIQDVNPGAAY